MAAVREIDEEQEKIARILFPVAEERVLLEEEGEEQEQEEDIEDTFGNVVNGEPVRHPPNRLDFDNYSELYFCVAVFATDIYYLMSSKFPANDSHKTDLFCKKNPLF